MWVVLYFMVALAANWVAINLLGWWITYHQQGYPLNWRILAGPWVYDRWLREEGLR